MARRMGAVFTLVLSFLIGAPVVAHACGGLVAGRHAEVLRRATTLAAWFNGVEHYVTGFTFAGTANTFGYIIPLPAAPSDVKKGGDWMLERLEREAFPPPPVPLAPRRTGKLLAPAALPAVQVLRTVKIDSLDIRVVRGGAKDVVRWAEQHGFDMTDDTDELLAKYPAKVFALAKFEKENAGRTFVEGQGVVIDFTIPLPGPWIPLQILSLGKHGTEVVNAHLFLLTPERPALTPRPQFVKGMKVVHSGRASRGLIADLRSDTGTSWIPRKAWFTAIDLSAPARTVRYDLATVLPIAPFAISRLPLGGQDAHTPLSFPAQRAEPWAWWLTAAALLATVSGLLRRSVIRKDLSDS